MKEMFEWGFAASDYWTGHKKTGFTPVGGWLSFG